MTPNACFQASNVDFLLVSLREVEYGSVHPRVERPQAYCDDKICIKKSLGFSLLAVNQRS